MCFARRTPNLTAALSLSAVLVWACLCFVFKPPPPHSAQDRFRDLEMPPNQTRGLPNTTALRVAPSIPPAPAFLVLVTFERALPRDADIVLLFNSYRDALLSFGFPALAWSHRALTADFLRPRINLFPRAAKLPSSRPASPHLPQFPLNHCGMRLYASLNQSIVFSRIGRRRAPRSGSRDSRSHPRLRSRKFTAFHLYGSSSASAHCSLYGSSPARLRRGTSCVMASKFEHASVSVWADELESS
ncbi:hypothetical protein B0H15DRAFT_962105 [Mycena belliarum]|uniref:Uncharacterized protein n=1 Tax=Mycena belliarum TaxID=1033014 RepID=A0AAD6TNW8_9AGAR|nr:hypothetical protein B0H15DRAFT_962105 [Mycena belliae]